MKINEVKVKPKKKVNEASPAWAAIKSVFGKDTGLHKLTQDIFIDDFVQDAMVSIKNGIAGGWVADPKLSPTKPKVPIEGDKVTGEENPPVKESTYDKLNAIFESIIQEEGNSNQKSLEEYLLMWYNGYMKNVNWQEEEAHVKQLIKNVAETYRKDRGKAALMQLAQTSYSISKAYGSVPRGAFNATSNAQTTNQQKKNVDQIKADIEALRKQDPTVGNELITDLIKTYAGAKPK